MSKQLGINPKMDTLACNNRPGHWSCVFPKVKSGWLRADGEDAVITLSPQIPELTDEIVINSLKRFDLIKPIGKDWQQPEKYNIDVIRKSYGFTIDTDGQILGLVAGDMGYEDTGMFVDDACKEAINAITGDK